MKKKIITFLAMLTLVGAPTLVFSQGNLESAGEHLKRTATAAGTTEEKIENIAGTAINAVLTLVGLIFLMLMVYAGYLWMTARGETDQVDKAKKIITGSIIGLVITVSAYAITVFITTRFETPQACDPQDPNSVCYVAPS